MHIKRLSDPNATPKLPLRAFGTRGGPPTALHRRVAVLGPRTRRTRRLVMQRILWSGALTLATSLALASTSHANEIGARGDGLTKITAANKQQLDGLLPPDYVQYVKDYADLNMTIGPTREYPTNPAYLDATKKYACQAKLDAKGQLVGYTAGQPF